MATDMDHHYHHSYCGNEWSQTEVPLEGQQSQVHSKITLSVAFFFFLSFFGCWWIIDWIKGKVIKVKDRVAFCDGEINIWMIGEVLN